MDEKLACRSRSSQTDVLSILGTKHSCRRVDKKLTKMSQFIEDQMVQLALDSSLNGLRYSKTYAQVLLVSSEIGGRCMDFSFIKQPTL